jgi:energy-coupling factor transport system ATP-binding protein
MSIELKNVSFAYPNGYLANENLNLIVNDGEKVAIVGQNGAGKTTAVKMMNGLNRPQSGVILVNGQDIKPKTCAQISRDIGYVFQNPDEQIFNSTVRSEIEYMPRYYKLSEKEISRKTGKAVELTGIREYMKTNPLDLPFPIRKFVAIAAIIATEPKFIILDEPTAGQDNHGNRILTNLIGALMDEGIGIITITHDMNFVAANFPRIVAMAHKNIIADGSAREIFWNNSIIKECGIKKPQIAQIAEELGLSGNILFRHELVEAVN